MHPSRFILPLTMLFLSACGPAAPEATATATEPAPPSSSSTSTATPVPTATPTPFPMDEAGAFTGAPQDFMLRPEELDGAYAAQDAGEERPNSFVLENRADGAAYIQATGRLGGWLRQYNRVNGAGPSYIVQVVSLYANPVGAELSISQGWHTQVWGGIESGALELLPGVPGLGVSHLVWRNSATGDVGLEMIYRNLYIFFTGPAEGEDYYDFFAELARTHLEWIRAQEP